MPSELRESPLDSKSPLPLVLEPTADAHPETIARVLDANRALIDARLLTHGAILLRGVDIHEPIEFERIAKSLAPHLKNDYLGTSPRDAVTEYVFNASELPPFYPIPQHCEMSFVKEPPVRLMFSCLIAPESEGGETPLCDFGAVYRDLDPEVRARFDARGVRNIRNYAGPEGGAPMGPWQLKPWHALFGTTDKAAVEATCRANDFEFTWLPGGKLRLVNTQPATRKHPVSGETVWFNHSQVFHLSQAPGEFGRIAKRQDALRMGALTLFAKTLVGAQRLLKDDADQAMHCTFGDGTPIPDADMEAVRDAIWKNLRTFRWRRGDVVLIDNFAVSHGRLPYRGPRKVVVAWS